MVITGYGGKSDAIASLFFCLPLPRPAIAPDAAHFSGLALIFGWAKSLLPFTKILLPMETPSINPIATRNGLIIGAVFALYSVFLYATGMQASPSAGMLNFVVSLLLLVGGLVVTFNAYKGLNNGLMSFGTGFKGGMIFIAITTLLNIVAMYIYLQFIDPSALDAIVEAQREAMSQDPNLSEEQIDHAMEIASAFVTPGAIAIMGFIMNMVMGAILSLIVAAIMKKDDNNYY
jgi:hypothetical protein